MENGILYEYKSDYDLLVDAYHDDLKAHLRIEIKVNEVLRDTGIVKTPVSIIFHPGKHLDQSLRLGNYFFKDISLDSDHCKFGPRVLQTGILLASRSGSIA